MSIDVDEENDDTDNLVEDGDEKTTVAEAAASSTRYSKRSSSRPNLASRLMTFSRRSNMFNHDMTADVRDRRGIITCHRFTRMMKGSQNTAAIAIINQINHQPIHASSIMSIMYPTRMKRLGQPSLAANQSWSELDYTTNEEEVYRVPTVHFFVWNNGISETRPYPSKEDMSAQFYSIDELGAIINEAYDESSNHMRQYNKFKKMGVPAIDCLSAFPDDEPPGPSPYTTATAVVSTSFVKPSSRRMNSLLTPRRETTTAPFKRLPTSTSSNR